MKKILKKYNIKPSKKLGQNFLIDKSVLRKIITAANLSKKDIVLEIGPGLGILTTELAKQVKQVIAVEKDKRLCNALAHILTVQDVQNVQIVNQDILDTKYKIPDTKYKLVANLPYYITSPVIRKFLETKHRPKSMILMVQKEVAQRIIAKPPKMNLLAVAVQFYAKSEIVAYVNKKSFWPQPKVDSAIIKIVPNVEFKKSCIDTKKFFKIVKAGFSSKRKMLKNNLKIEESMLEKLGINPQARAENLFIKEWLKLYEML
jgi:16S rRNA (adenine1518-N6/adenine1519-N6)-dimethyltransferase